MLCGSTLESHRKCNWQNLESRHKAEPSEELWVQSQSRTLKGLLEVVTLLLTGGSLEAECVIVKHLTVAIAPQC